MYLNGDDSLMAIANSIIGWFNDESIAKELHQYGVEMTCDHGVGNIVDFDFLSQRFVKLYGCYLPLVDADKMISNLFYDKSYHPLMTLLKVFAIRTETWPNEKLRVQIHNLITDLLRDSNPDMKLIIETHQGEVEMGFEEVMQNYLSDRQLKHLYTGIQ